MAEIKKFKTPAVKAVFVHANRTATDGHKHSNENIDLDRTKYNYRLKTGGVKDWKKRLDEVFRVKRSDNVTFAEVIVTLPKDVREEDERRFFQSCYEFFCKDFGDENVMYATVHKDEIQPHMHLGFLPVEKKDITYDDYPNQKYKSNLDKWVKKHNELPKERLLASAIINRPYLNTMHERLQMHVDNYLGYHASVLNGATAKGNKTVLELKVKTLQEKEQTLKESIGGIKEDAKMIKQTMEKTGITSEDFALYPLLQKIENLQEQNTALMEVLTRNGCSYSPNELKPKNYIPAKSAPLNVYEGSLVDEQLTSNAVVVIELPKHKDDSPQQKYINEDFDLRQMITFAKNSDDEVRVKRSRTSDKVFVIIKTDDDVKKTITNLIVMEQMLKEIEDIRSRKIYMDRIESDRYDLARSILTSNNFQAAYFEKKSTIDKMLEEEKEQIENIKE